MRVTTFCESYWCGEYIPTIKEFKAMGKWDSLSPEFQQQMIKQEDEARLYRRLKEKMKRSAYKNKRKPKIMALV